MLDTWTDTTSVALGSRLGRDEHRDRKISWCPKLAKNSNIRRNGDRSFLYISVPLAKWNANHRYSTLGDPRPNACPEPPVFKASSNSSHVRLHGTRTGLTENTQANMGLG